MPIHRRDFLKAGAIGGVGLLAGCTREKEAEERRARTAPYDFEMTIRDGYAYIFNRARTNLVVGAIDAHGKPHPIVLEMDRGRVVGTPKVKSIATNVWDLSGWHVELDLGSGAGALKTPDETWPEVMACPTATEWNNLAWLPPAAKIYTNPALASDWAPKLSSRLVIRQGSLSVGPSNGPGLFQFRDAAGKTVWEQALSNVTLLEQRGIPSGNVVFNLFRLSDTLPESGAQPEGQLEIESDAGVILKISNGLPPQDPYKVGEAISHFGRYSQLLEEPQGADILPHFYPCGSGQGSCPGDFCPYVRFEI